VIGVLVTGGAFKGGELEPAFLAGAPLLAAVPGLVLTDATATGFLVGMSSPKNK
jgi:hypothetical protein